MKTFKIMTTAVLIASAAALAALAVPAHAGDVKAHDASYSCQGLSHGLSTIADGGIRASVAEVDIVCPLIRDLPQKARLKRLKLKLFADGRFGTAGYRHCILLSRDFLGEKPTKFTTSTFPENLGLFETFVMEYRNVSVHKHGTLQLSCKLGKFDRIVAIQIEE